MSMTGVLLAAGFGNWVVSDRCRAPLIVWSGLSELHLQKVVFKIIFFPFFPMHETFEIVRCQALNHHRADAGVVRVPSSGYVP